MKRTLSQICLVAALFAVPLMSGCSEDTETKAVTGVTEDFLDEIRAGQEQYGKEMEGGGASKTKK